MDFVDAIDRTRTLNHWIVSPYSSCHWIWETTIFIMAIFLTFEVPYQLAFGKNLPAAILTLHISAAFLIAIGVIVKYFDTAYIDHETRLLIDNRTQIWNNSKKSWLFYIDCISAIFLSVPILPFARRYQFYAIPFLFLRALSIGGFFDRLECWLTFSNYCLGTFREWFVRLVRITKSSWVLILWIHCNGCLFYSIAEYHNNDNTWLGKVKDDHKSDLDKYIDAIYWATTTVTTVGYGDFHPVNKGERVLSVIIMILNIGFDAYFLYSLKYVFSPVRPLPSEGEPRVTFEMSSPHPPISVARALSLTTTAPSTTHTTSSLAHTTPFLTHIEMSSLHAPISSAAPTWTPAAPTTTRTTPSTTHTVPTSHPPPPPPPSAASATQPGLMYMPTPGTTTQPDPALPSSSSAPHVDPGTSSSVQQSVAQEIIELVN